MLDRTALYIAVSDGCPEIVCLLLEHPNIKVNEKMQRGEAALHLAALRSDRTEWVRLLLTHKNININLKNKDGNTALHLAILNKNTETAKLLLAHRGQALKTFIRKAKKINHNGVNHEKK